jgi:hypothetical protein
MKPISVLEWENAIYSKALVTVQRAPDKSFVESDLEAALADLIQIDIPKEKKRRAHEIISGRAKPGGTEPAGQLVLPGFDPYFYEPDRLVRDDTGHAVENCNATIAFKQAESRRARDHAADAALSARQKTEEAERFAAWAMDQMAKGRPALDLTWGTCVNENAYLAA